MWYALAQMRSAVIILGGVVLILVIAITVAVVMFSQRDDSASNAASDITLLESSPAESTQPLELDVVPEMDESSGSPHTLDTMLPGMAEGMYRRNAYADRIASQRDHQPEDGPRLEFGAEFDITKEFIFTEVDSTNLAIESDTLHGGAPFDSIKPLVSPDRISVDAVRGLTDDEPIIVCMIGEDVLGCPASVLRWHESVQDVVGDTPVAITFNALCGSAVAFDRRVTVIDNGGETVEKTLNFGVSGLIANSNTVLYDKSFRALWSPLRMVCISGPHRGTRLRTLPVAIMTLRAFRQQFPGGELVSNESARFDYTINPYQQYSAVYPDALMFPVDNIGDALPKKTPGVGVIDRVSGEAIFVPHEVIAAQQGSDGDAFVLHTEAGPVTLRADAAGTQVLEVPAEADAAVCWYFAWSAFHPATRIVSE